MIGILSQPIPQELLDAYNLTNIPYHSFIMDSYVKFVQSAGARAVPIIYHGDMDKELEKLEHLNGVLYCGGSATGKEYIEFGR